MRAHYCKTNTFSVTVRLGFSGILKVLNWIFRPEMDTLCPVRCTVLGTAAGDGLRILWRNATPSPLEENEKSVPPPGLARFFRVSLCARCGFRVSEFVYDKTINSNSVVRAQHDDETRNNRTVPGEFIVFRVINQRRGINRRSPFGRLRVNYEIWDYLPTADNHTTVREWN